MLYGGNMNFLKERLQSLSGKNFMVVLAVLLLCVGGFFVSQGWAEEEKTPISDSVSSYVSVEDDPRTVMVLNYHKVANEHMSLSVTLDDFEQHMKWLKEYGYTSITPDELYAFITEGAALPDKPVLITFDDGYKDNYTNAFPIMQKYGMKGTIFVVTGFLGVYENYLTWEQAKELLDKGFSIESHTYSHKSMTEASDDELMKELTKSKDKIKEKLGVEANFLAYPTGTYNLHIAALAQAAGYKGAFTIKYDNVSRETNVFAIERVPIFHTENTNKDFLERIQYLPLTYKYGWVKK